MKKINAFYRMLMIFILISLSARFAGFLRSWPEVLLMTMTLVFFFAGVSHFTKARHDFEKMVPPAIPARMLIVYVTGVLEVVGAITLQIPSLQKITAVALILFLIAVFPANYYAAKSGTLFRGKAHLGVVQRGLIQLGFILALYFGALA
ncbi:DoxX family protein [Bdellovibrio svalbardensis]|uniref:DoxX family protein n=1 Tax=Bdellovibrio svalbardensis TaxID=2972972 RepID=A0ABT6DE70_9BACT|nr:hypothetical protein [Bdellovibrio svalbardensis]MDG0815121.1 hypothetical protein [Bdellovibrio svalbardensis]